MKGDPTSIQSHSSRFVNITEDRLLSLVGQDVLGWQKWQNVTLLNPYAPSCFLFCQTKEENAIRNTPQS